mgnify:CR=1 FL=1
MMRVLALLLIAILVPAFAADAPAPGEPSGPPGRRQDYALISVADVIRITEILAQMTDALEEQDAEIRRLKAKLARGGCI